MPYFIYRITERPIRQLVKLEQHDAYREASQRAKQLRREPGNEPPAVNVKVIFAENELHAEDLLNEVREPAPELGDD
jgi:hypothetical protein